MSNQNEPWILVDKLILKTWLNWDRDVWQPDGHSVVLVNWFKERGVPKKVIDYFSNTREEYEEWGAYFQGKTNKNDKFICYFTFISHCQDVLETRGSFFNGKGRIAKDYCDGILEKYDEEIKSK